MAIKYPGEQKIGYGEAQVFDTSKLAEGAWKGVEKIEKKKKEKKKAEDDFKKNLTNIDVSKIRDVDVPYINSQVNAVSDFFYKNSAAIMNPKLDGGKANMELSKLKTHAVGEVQRSIGIKAEDKLLDDKIANEPDFFGTHENYELSHNRHRTPMNSSLWNDYTSPTTTEEIDLTMTGEEKDDFYSKSISEISKTLFPGGEADEEVVKTASDIRSYDNYEDYYNATGSNYIDEDQFDNLKSEYNEYETKWNESQGTFETVTHGGETTVGLHNQSLNANPMLGDYIEERAANIVNFSDTEITKLAEEKVGEGNVNIFEVKKEIAKEKIIAGIVGGINMHRFKPEMKEELANMLKERQQDDPNLTMEDLVLELAEPFVKQLDTDVQWVRDIFKPKPTRINVGDKPKPIEFARPLGQLDNKFNFHFTGGNDLSEGGGGFGHTADWNFNLLNEGSVDGQKIGGVDITQVVSGEGTTKDVLNISTTSKGFRQLGGVDEDSVKKSNWTNVSGSIQMNPSMIFPSPVFTETKEYKGVWFEKGDRIPQKITKGNTVIDFSEYFPSINDDGEYEPVQDTEIAYFLQGVDKNSKQPIIVEYDNQVRKNIESWVLRQTDSNKSISEMNKLLGLPDLGDDRGQ
jgi:hypothetical protein